MKNIRFLFIFIFYFAPCSSLVESYGSSSMAFSIVMRTHRFKRFLYSGVNFEDCRSDMEHSVSVWRRFATNGVRCSCHCSPSATSGPHKTNITQGTGFNLLSKIMRRAAHLALRRPPPTPRPTPPPPRPL